MKKTFAALACTLSLVLSAAAPAAGSDEFLADPILEDDWATQEDLSDLSDLSDISDLDSTVDAADAETVPDTASDDLLSEELTDDSLLLDGFLDGDGLADGGLADGAALDGSLADGIFADDVLTDGLSSGDDMADGISADDSMTFLDIQESSDSIPESTSETDPQSRDEEENSLLEVDPSEQQQTADLEIVEEEVIEEGYDPTVTPDGNTGTLQKRRLMKAASNDAMFISNYTSFRDQLDEFSQFIYDKMVYVYITRGIMGSTTATDTSGTTVPAERITFTDAETAAFGLTFEAQTYVGTDGKLHIDTTTDAYKTAYAHLCYHVQSAIDAFTYDHPEVYWYRPNGYKSGFSATPVTTDGQTTYLGYFSSCTLLMKETFTGAYDLRSTFSTQVDAVSAQLASSSDFDGDGDVSTLEYIQAAHDYIIRRGYYDHSALASYTSTGDYRIFCAAGMFVDSVGSGIVCEGYSKAMKVLLNAQGIACCLIPGVVTSSNEGHMWNCINFNGSWYLTDVTWDDKKGEPVTSEYFTYYLVPRISGRTTSSRISDSTKADALNFAYPAVAAVADHTFVQTACTPYSKYSCSDGDGVAYFLSATTHVLSRLDAIEPTCTTEGRIECYTCTVCSKYFADSEGAESLSEEQIKRPTSSHTLIRTEEKAPTCEIDGNIEYYTCSVCGNIFSDEAGQTQITIEDTIVPAGHTLVRTEAKAPTCEEEGNIAYYTCSACGKLYSDEGGTGELTQAEIVLPATGHTLVKIEVVPATCESDGTIAHYTCSVCGKLYRNAAGTQFITEEELIIPKIGHVLVKTSAKAATCDSNGNIEYYTCNNCGKYYGDAEGNEELTQEQTLIPATGHTLAKTDAVSATCETAGNIEYYTCRECGKLYRDAEGNEEITQAQIVLSATGHTFEKTEAVAAACETAGNIEYYTCSNCEKIFSDPEGTKEITQAETVTAATGHDLVMTAAKAATCETAGNIEYYTCNNCEKIFSDSEGTKEVTQAETVTAATGHNLVMTAAEAATCETIGNIEYYTCSSCEKIFSDPEGTVEITHEQTITAAIGHALEKITAKDATCEIAGNIEYYTCRNCEKSFSDPEGTKEITQAETVVPATGHKLERIAAKAATCETAGNIEYYTCRNCEKIFSDPEGTKEITQAETVTAATGHDLVMTAAKAATCETAGNIEYYTCNNCEKIFSDSEGTKEITQAETVTAATGHNLVRTAAKAATCETTGNIEYYTCSSCEKIFSDSKGTVEITQEQTVTAAIGHSLVKIAAKDATCETAGNIEYYICSSCEKIFSDSEGTEEITQAETVVSATGHKLERTASKAATCEAAGNIEYYTCSSCEKIFSDYEGTKEITQAETVVPATGHKLERTASKAATCEAAGNIEYYTCSSCEKIFSDSKGTVEITQEQTVTAATGHSLVKIAAKDATCETVGNIEHYACSSCGKLYRDEEGTEELTQEQIVTATIAHELVKTEAVAATCETAGNNEYYTCSSCEKIFSDMEGTKEITQEETVISATGHALTKTEAVAATCETAGNIEYYTCSECGKIFSDQEGTKEITQAETVTPATGHALTKTEAVAATCETAGNIEYYTCSECGKIFSDQEGTKEITQAQTAAPATGHKLMKTASKAATCETAGNIEYYTCSECGKIFSDPEGTKEITQAETVTPATGHSLTKTEAVAATCETAGNIAYYTCSTCKKIFSDSKGTKDLTKAQTVIAATGHSWDKGKITKYPTVSATGVRTYTCKHDASHTKKVTLPKLTKKEAEGSASKKSTVAWAEKKIIASGGELAGSSAADLRLYSTKQTQNSITLKWNKVKGAEGYILYGAAHTKGSKISRIRKITGGSKTSYTVKKLKKATFYKYSLAAYKTVNGIETVIASSKMIYVVTKGGKLTNISKVKASKKSVSVKKGKTTKVKATTTKQAKTKKLKTYRALRYVSSNTKIAAVNAKTGKITAKKAGSCYIYVYAQTGVFARIKVTVR